MKPANGKIFRAIAPMCVVLMLAVDGGKVWAADGDFVWAKALGGTGTDIAYSVAVDAAGNVFTAGYFQGTADFDPGVGTFNLTSAGNDDIFVSKVDANGNFVWAKRIGGSAYDYARSIVLDASGNLYITGNFQITVDFDPSVSIFNLTSAGDWDVFVSKYDTNGDFVWAKAIGGINADVGFSIALDTLGNFHTTGYFQGTTDFDPGSGIFNLSSAGSSDIFVSKLDANGDFVWAKAMGGLSGEVGLSLAVDTLGNTYTTGFFNGIGDFDPGIGAYNFTSVGQADIFVSKLDTNGDFVWAKRTGWVGDDVGSSIAVDMSGNVYTTGVFIGTVDFDPGTGTINHTSTGGGDIFISKLNANGDYIWTKSMGGLAGDGGESIALDALGNVYTAGWFYGTVDFDSGAATYLLTSAGNEDIFVSKLDSSGNFVWAKAMGGTGSDYGLSFAVETTGNVCTTGRFENTADFDPGAGFFNLTSVGGIGIFVSKLSGPPDTTPPTLLLSSTAADPVNAAITVDVTLSEVSTDFDASDITATNATVSSFSGSGVAYSFTLTPTTDGAFSAEVLAGMFTDTATNGNTASNVLSRTADLTAPSFSNITASPSSAYAGQVVTISFDSSETLQGLPTVTVNGNAASFESMASLSYSFSYTVDMFDPLGIASIEITGQDTAGNIGLETNNTTLVIDPPDLTPPTITLSSAAGDPVNAGITVDVLLSEVSTDFDALDISPNNAMVSGFTGGGTGYSFILTPTSDGSFDAQVIAGMFTDAAGNGNTASNVLSRTADVTPPAFMNITADPINAYSGQTVTITFDALEALQANPTVTVNGNVASFVGVVGLSYTYSYPVTVLDVIGAATIDVIGVDLIGNNGLGTNDGALTIIDVPPPAVPLALWPGIIALAAAGAMVLRKRR